MRFCEKCGNLMIVDKKTKHTFLVCRKCGRTTKLKREKIAITESLGETKKHIVVMGKDDFSGELPKTKEMCPQCDHAEAFWWMQQTRAADEPPTLFYKCCKCGYSWRSYG
jgi:DNA-directed RNA polymerase subunit M